MPSGSGRPLAPAGHWHSHRRRDIVQVAGSIRATVTHWTHWRALCVSHCTAWHTRYRFTIIMMGGELRTEDKPGRTSRAAGDRCHSVSESVLACRGSFAGVVIELVSLSTTSTTSIIISFTLFSSSYTVVRFLRPIPLLYSLARGTSSRSSS